MKRQTIDTLIAYVIASSGINIIITLFFVQEYASPKIQHTIIDWALTIFLVNISCILILKEITYKKIKMQKKKSIHKKTQNNDSGLKNAIK